MNEKLIEGYMAYTSAEEVSTAATGEAPATPLTVTISVATAGAASGASLSLTVQNHC